MEPTLTNNDVGIAIKENKHIEKGDIVIVVLDKNKRSAPSHKTIIKRVIATEGDVISFKNDKVYINEKELKEPYITSITPSNTPPTTLRKNEFFVMGDNRVSSYDSRSFGVITREEIKGRWLFENKIASYISHKTQQE